MTANKSYPELDTETMNLTATTKDRGSAARTWYPLAKRAMDITLCLLVLLFVWPVWLIISILIRLNSPGPALFVQERVGKNAQRFQMYKFRTMPVNLDRSKHEAFMRSFVNGRSAGNAGGDGPHKPVQDSQITPIGRFLRKTSLDELPQLLNVLKGDMSLVGPRPNVPWEVEEYKPWHCRRLEVLPGLTGLAQVKGFRSRTEVMRGKSDSGRG
mgnify:CR=1 FL=1